MAAITIFHTSDLHNKLTSDMSARLRELKASVPDTLLLDSGDAIWAGNIFWRPGGEPILDLMNDAGYDAMCMGNREFHFTQKGIFAKTDRARFPILSTNLRPAREGIPLPAKPHIIVKRAGLKIGLLGLSVPCITHRMLVKRVSDYYFVSPADAASEAVPELRSTCDLVVALSHIGIKPDRELAEQAPGIDVILGGHTHALTLEPERVGDTYILHHGSHGHFVGRVDITLEAGEVSVKQELIPLKEA
jgi:5'-nucleotidase / UDP-sugar diphosphatase